MLNRHKREMILTATVGGVIGSLFTGAILAPSRTAVAGADDRKPVFDEVTVKRLNVVDEDGKLRVVLSNSDRFPSPVLKGRTFPRSIQPAGFVFYKKDGDEAGGIALLDAAGVTKNFLAFDYSNSEAIGVGVLEKPGGGFEAGISLLDRQPLDSDVLKVGSTGVERVSVSNDDGTASIALNDPKGKERIRLSVDKDGNTRFEIKDAEGKVVYKAPTGTP